MGKNLNISITEKQILHYFIDNPKDLINDSIFITEIAKELQTILLELKELSIDFIPEHIIKKSKELINMDVLESVLATKYQKDALPTYIRELHDYNLHLTLETKLFKEITLLISKKGTKDVQELKSLYNSFGNILEKLENKKDCIGLTIKEMLEEHENFLINRFKGIQQSSGDPNFDSILGSVSPGLAVIAAYSGNGKTTLMMYLALIRLIKRLPTVYVNTELDFDRYVDNMLPYLLNVPFDDITKNDENSNNDSEMILQMYRKLITKYEKTDRNSRFLYYPKPSISIKELKTFLTDSRSKMGLHKEQTLFAFVDLLSMLKEFNVSHNGLNRADAIDIGVTEINNFCLENNIFLLGSVQLKRKDGVKRIEREDDITNFIPSLEAIKGSGAWVERARWAFTLHSPYNIVNMHPCNPVLKALIDPISYITCFKNTYESKLLGKQAMYLFDLDYKRFSTYKEEDSN